MKAERSEMEFTAKLNYVRVSPQKARLVLDLIKGRRVEEALDTLTYAKQGIAPALYKLLRSAIENANYVTLMQPIYRIASHKNVTNVKLTPNVWKMELAQIKPAS